MPDSINPATGRIIAHYPRMSEEEIGGITGAATGAARQWAATPPTERARGVESVATVLEKRLDELSLLITQEMGKPIGEARSEIEKCAWVCRYYAENGPRFLSDESIPTDAYKSFASFEPLGVVLAVMPWNFPFWQVFRFASPALVAGNGILLKHASNVSGCALAIESVFREAGLPADLFRTLITGAEEVRQLIASDAVQAVTLTGSEPAGSAVAEAAGKAIKKSVLELGGSDPYLILVDADLDLAAEKCAQARLLNAGQVCIAAKRFIVDSSIKEAFTEKLLQHMSGRTMGNPELDATRIGPMARADLRDELHQQVQESIAAGARLLMGGKIPEGPGYFYPPTLLANVRPGMPAFDEELFGPVAAVIEAADTEEAVQLANKSQFGLGAAVFTRDLRTGESVARKLQAGVCFINDFVKSDPRMPFGGIKKSGYGRELSHFGIREFTNIKSIVI
jgi:succinate-semialdehyde dehydrogenase/glutarate-semialdehyde dehydrogenase